MPRFDKLIVLDLDETLVYSVDSCQYDKQSPSELEFFSCGDLTVYKRPNVQVFISTLLEWFDVSIWTAGTEEYAHIIASELFRENVDRLRFIMTSANVSLRYDHEIGEYSKIKPLKKVVKKGFKLANILHIDNTPSTFSVNYGNGILVRTWTGQPNDDELMLLLVFLEWLGPLENVRRIDKRDWQSRVASWLGAK
jgi:carboxy-terminal domain RNA polymerase II polypeptide A small phosphatase